MKRVLCPALATAALAYKAALAKVKVGDRLDITWTTAVLISVEAPK